MTIRANGLTKFYDRRCVVNDLAFSIADREIVGFLGLNGAGKTTALKMLAGLLEPSAGTIEIDGADLLQDPLNMRWQIGFLPERPPLYDDMTVRAYLTFAAELRGFAHADVARRVDEVIRVCTLTNEAQALISTLSHGFRQRVGIAQAIVHDPRLVILDEPISGLDPAQIIEMRKLILSLKERHTVLLSSHILSEISQTCDRLLVIHAGQLVEQGTESDIAARLGGNKKRVVVEIVGSKQRAMEVMTDAMVHRADFGFSHDNVHEIRVELVESRPEALAELLVRSGLALRRLEPQRGELEAMFLELTKTRS